MIISMNPKDAAIAATQCYNEACSLAQKFLHMTEDPSDLSAVVGSMLFAKFCKSEFVASLGKEHENDATLFMQEMEEMIDIKSSEFIQNIRGKST